LRPVVDGNQVVRFPSGVRIREVRDNGGRISVTPATQSTVRLNLRAGRVYQIEFERPPN
jgi:hypothetical protein